MKRRGLLIVIGLFVILIGAGIVDRIYASPPVKTPHTASVRLTVASSIAIPVTPPTRDELLTLVNAERAKNGVAPLAEDRRLDTSAQEKAVDETTYNYFGHISPATSPNAGKDSHNYIFDTGISCTDSSENLTENTNQNTAQAAVTAWINSPPHHQAMINPAYSLTGFGISGNEIVEHFCQQ